MTRSCSIGTLTFRVYNESRDKRFVNLEVISDDGEVGNIDCSLKEWHGLQDVSVLRAERDRLRAEVERLSFYETTSAAEAIRMLNAERAEVRRLQHLVEEWRGETVERGDAANELITERDRMRPVFEAAVAMIEHQKTADIAHVVPGWLRHSLDLNKALEIVVDAAIASEKGGEG